MLDFDAMRLEMGLAHDQPILEAIDALADHDAERCRAILHRHEYEGGRRAVLMPGVPEFLADVRRRGLHTAVWTRNSRAVALATLARTGLEFEVIVVRDDAPAKPDPTALVELAKLWRLPASELLMVGDYVFDIDAGRRAGAYGALYGRCRAGNLRRSRSGRPALRVVSRYGRALARLGSRRMPAFVARRKLR
ncbi:MAG: HAD-IA family hydrolase [Pirellulales bacterium]